jgi:hypothetical protein
VGNAHTKLLAYPSFSRIGQGKTARTSSRKLPQLKNSAELLGGGVIFRRRYALTPTERSLKTDPSEFVSPYKRI